MNEKEALTRMKTGNFNGGYGFDMQLLVDAVGIIGEMFKSGQISEVVRCKECIHWDRDDVRGNEAICKKYSDEIFMFWKDADWYCADGKRRSENE